MTAHSTQSNGFVNFFRGYTKTWVHAVATAGLTTFGMLTFLDRWFACLAIASYLLPPIVLYVRRVRTADSASRNASLEPAVSPSTSSRRSEPPSARPETRTPSRSNGTSGVPEQTRLEHVERPRRSVADETDTDDGREGDGRSTDWRVVESPTDATLLEGAIVDGGAYAVGTGGIVLATTESESRSTTDDWSVVLEDGPGARSNDLRGVDATADGRAVWVAGDGGAIGRIDVETGRHTDYSAPADRTDNLAGIAVGGDAGEETVLVINGSGEVLPGRYDGSAVTWADPVKPGSGSSLVAVSLVDASVGFCCDTSDGVFETADGGESFDRIGLEGSDGTLVDVAALDRGPDEYLVAADDGVVLRYRADGSNWTPERISDALSGLAGHGERTVACDAHAIYERPSRTANWESVEPDVAGPLEGVAVGEMRALAVGADGTIVERRWDRF